jgi:hypothetical protein
VAAVVRESAHEQQVVLGLGIYSDVAGSVFRVGTVVETEGNMTDPLIERADDVIREHLNDVWRDGGCEAVRELQLCPVCGRKRVPLSPCDGCGDGGPLARVEEMIERLENGG